MLFLCFCFRNGKSLIETETAEKCQKTAESLFFVLEPYGIIKSYKEKGRFYEMITRLEEIPVTKESYPFASAERYLKLSERGYVEKEYYMYGTANVYETADERGGVRVRTADAPYTNRIIVRAPQDTTKCSGNVVVEIINPTSFMEIDRMWILGWKKFVRDGDIYVGITSKPNTIAKMVEFDEKRYGCLSWANPTPDVPFSERLQATGGLGDLNHDYETGLFWDMLTDLAWLLRGDEEQNPIREYKREYVYLTGWSQSGSYLFRYLNSFAYRPEVARGACVFNGYLSGGGVHSLGIPVNQYETMTPYHYSLTRVEKAREPFIAVQTESENGRMEAWRIAQQDSDDPEFLFRQYDVTGASHDTSYSYVNYYQNDPDLVRINHLPFYMGKNEEGNDYPSQILFAAAFRNLFTWVRTGAAPAHCDRIAVDSDGENKKDAFGNTIGGLRTCLLDYPTGRYSNTSDIEKGQNFLDPESEKEGLFGYQQAFSKEMIKELYGTLAHYREMAEKNTKEQVTKGFVCREDAAELVEIAVQLAKKRGLE